jgi:SAM-dependent methyltransferase
LTFADHFSGHAEEYARRRPDYPGALFAWLAGVAPSRRRAWDCATGNGQAALGLAAHFERVVATDASLRQLAAAAPHPRVRYAAAAAEACGLLGGCADLVTAAQSLHWLDRERFWAEAARVLAPAGAVAVWSYGLVRVSPAVDAVLDGFYSGLAGHWPAGRELVETGYRTIAIPPAFEELSAPPFAMEKTWSLDDLAGYLDTWSAVRRFMGETGRDAVAELRPGLAAAWGAPANVSRAVTWDLALRVARRRRSGGR